MSQAFERKMTARRTRSMAQSMVSALVVLLIELIVASCWFHGTGLDDIDRIDQDPKILTVNNLGGWLGLASTVYRQ